MSFQKSSKLSQEKPEVFTEQETPCHIMTARDREAFQQATQALETVLPRPSSMAASQHTLDAPLVNLLPVASRWDGTDSGSAGRISLLDPRTSGARTENLEVGYLDGSWTDRKKEFKVQKLNIKGELSRSRIFEIADRLHLREAIQRSLEEARNDDPIQVDLYCDFGSISECVVHTPIPGTQQELVASLIPAIQSKSPDFEITVLENTRPLRLLVRVGE